MWGSGKKPIQAREVKKGLGPPRSQGRGIFGALTKTILLIFRGLGLDRGRGKPTNWPAPTLRSGAYSAGAAASAAKAGSAAATEDAPAEHSFVIGPYWSSLIGSI